jgi:hypothetical protein
VSEHVTPADVTTAQAGVGESASHSVAPGGAAVASPEFDRQEIRGFGADDGRAVTVIGQMLVGFFFYSLLVMTLVAAWTIWGFGQAHQAPADSHHSADTADF